MTFCLIQVIIIFISIVINVLIVCIIIQCLSHSADPAAVSEFTNPSTKKAFAEHLGASPAARAGPSLTRVSKVKGSLPKR